jgi:hypothetical protein
VSKVAQDYVLDLGKRVTRHQGHLLLALACYHQATRETYWPSHRTLAEKLGTDERQVRRIVAELKNLGILAYERGIGAGNLCDYRFPELEKRTLQPPFASEKTGQKEDKKEDNPALGSAEKEDNSTPAIRNIQSQNLTSTKTITPNGALSFWLRFKSELKAELPEQDWKDWLRPLYFLKELGSKHLLLALPPSTRVIEAYKAREPWLRNRLGPLGYSCSATHYPDEYEVAKACETNPEWLEIQERLFGGKKEPQSVSA